MKKNILFLLLVVFQFTACTKTDKKMIEKSNNSDNKTTIKTIIQKVKTVKKTPDSDPVSIRSISIKSNILSIYVVYAGGYKTHDFNLVWNEKRMASLPSQVNLHLVHNANQDKAEARLKKQLKFNIWYFDKDTIHLFIGKKQYKTIQQGRR